MSETWRKKKYTQHTHYWIQHIWIRFTSYLLARDMCCWEKQVFDSSNVIKLQNKKMRRSNIGVIITNQREQ